MKKKLLKLMYLSLMVIGLSNVYTASVNATMINPTPTPTQAPGITPTVTPTVTPPVTSAATPTPTVAPTVTPTITPVILPVTQITITQLPTKLTYYKGDELDLTGMIVQGYLTDGTTTTLTNYEVVGYIRDQIGPQTIMVYYQNQIAVFTVNVVPAKIKNITASYHDTTTITLSWDAVPGVSRYEIYMLDDLTGAYNLINYTTTNNLSVFYSPGTIHSYKIISVENLLGIEYRSEMSDPFITATHPQAVTNLLVTATGTYSVALSWDSVVGATGYMIYRSAGNTENYVLCGTTTTTTFKNNKLISGKGYKYKVSAYTLNENYTGDFSNVVDTSTNPNKVVMKYKAGEEKVRFSWSKVNGATSYDLYVGDSLNGFVLLTSLPGNKSTYSYIAEGLTTGTTYTFYAIARRDYNGIAYYSLTKDLLNIEIKTISPTSYVGKLFPTDQDFFKSWSYNSLEFFRTYVNYEKSYPIPGLSTTNVGGFSSTSMCPQGLTFAGDYLLMSSYDLKSEENTVIYVLDKQTKELLTTLVLPSKPHAGGLAFDGINVWVTNGSRVSAILYSDIDDAAQNQLPYTYVNYIAVCTLDIPTSYVTYYNEKLWVGTYNELQATNLYSYSIENKESTPTLTKEDTMIMPTRVQGLAFTSKGTLILSRSCQLYKGLRGYMRQLDVYKPAFAMAVDGVIPLGNLINSESMPSMNEGIAIDGNYLYVTFESGAFDKSTYRMDRICAFKLTDVVKKKVKK